MERCPSCDFPVQDEWNTCRRCGARLTHEPHTPSLPQRAGVRTAVRPVVTGPPARTRAVVATAPIHDTMLPHRVGAPDAADVAPARKTTDTLIPRSVRRPATIAALVGAGVAAVRLFGRRHRRH